MKIDLGPEEFAKLIFDTKTKYQREDDGCHGPKERCPNCDAHETCGNMVKSLVPWEELPSSSRANLITLSGKILEALEKRLTD